MSRGFRSARTRARTVTRAGIAALGLAALLVSGLPPLAETAAGAEAAPTPLAGEAPTNEVPDSEYLPPENRPEPPEVPEPERPAPDSPEGRALAAAEAVDATDIQAVSEALTLDVVAGEEIAASGVALEGPQDEALSVAVEETAGDKAKPDDPVAGEDAEAGVDPTLEAAAPRAQSAPAESTAPEQREATSAAAGCTQLPGVEYQGFVTFESMTSAVWANRSGSYRVRVSNTGKESWPAGSSVSYEVYDTEQNLI